MLEKRIILVQERISFIKTDEIKPWINYKERENLRNKQEAIEKKIYIIVLLFTILLLDLILL